MDTNGAASTGQDGQGSEALSVFISYRKADASSAAGRLRDRLKPLLGAGNVFFDVEALKPGMDWRQEIKASAESAGILLVVIGPHWLAALHERSQRAKVEPGVEDVVRDEVEFGLTSRGDVKVVPVLVDGASMPTAFDLPRSIQALSDQQAQVLRNESYDDDVKRLVEHLRRIAGSAATGTGTAVPRRDKPKEIPPDCPSRYRNVAETIVGRDQLIVMLGSGVTESRLQLPDDENLARALAREYAYPMNSPRVDLAEVAQYVYAIRGEPDLHRAIQERLTIKRDVTHVHRFLAGLPARTEALGYPRQNLLIVTTNYDTLLEQALYEAREPFDLAVYVASGGDKGKFVHVPWQETPAIVRTPNLYHDFPFNEDAELRRTLVVKIHGAVDALQSGYSWHNNFVVTEDNYIDYLSGGSIEELVPIQILGRLRNSHCLFLGYGIYEWTLRVFLKRVWGPQIKARSWAVLESPDELEEELWNQVGKVKLIDEPLDEYIEGLEACLDPSS